MHGSEILAKDVLDYVVFEKHLSYRYGVWRIHGKIIPDWKPLPEPGLKTFVVENEPEPESKDLSTVVDSQTVNESPIPPPPQNNPQSPPQLATA